MSTQNKNAKMPKQRTSHHQAPAANLRLVLEDRTIDGKTRQQRIWRSDNLMFSPAEEIQELKRQGLTTVIDLRSPTELEAESTDVLSTHGLHFLHRPLTRQAADPKTLSDTLSRIKTPEDVGRWYFRLALKRSQTLVQCLQNIAQSAGGVAFYCTAGKDRTGILAACFLLLVGAPEESIVEDYGKTNLSIDRVRIRRALSTGSQLPTGSDYDSDHPLLRANPDNMRYFLKYVSHCGGIRALLAGQASQPSRIQFDPSLPRPRNPDDIDAIARLQRDLVRTFAPGS